MSNRSYDTMINPQIEELLDCVDSKFSLVTLAARRARELQSYYAGNLGSSLAHIAPPQVPTVARKPLSMAFEEIAAHKIESVPYAEAVESDDSAAETA